MHRHFSVNSNFLKNMIKLTALFWTLKVCLALTTQRKTIEFSRVQNFSCDDLKLSLDLNNIGSRDKTPAVRHVEKVRI